MIEATAIVFECAGGVEGALSVVRTLGRRGVEVTVVTDDPQSMAGRSRYCKRLVRWSGYSNDEENIPRLLALANQLGNKPIVFPTADPDLLFLSRTRTDLADHVRHFLAPREIVDALSDKRRFIDFAIEHKLPVPRTWSPGDAGDVAAAAREARFPVVLKPSNPAAWTGADLQKAIGPRKAWTVADAEELRRTYDLIARFNKDVLIQECIVGPDDAHYSLHAYLNRDSKPLAWFTGRKVRIYPAYAGSGCFVESVYVEPMVRVGLQALEAMRYTGIAVINFKRDSRTGEFMIHEINPRVSQWNILATRCGVDIPYLAYADTAGMELAPISRKPFSKMQRERIRYVNLRCDLKALPAYRKKGDWTWRSYLRSLGMPWNLVHQTWAADDPGVLAASLQMALAGRFRSG